MLRWLKNIRYWFKYRLTDRYNVIYIKSLEPNYYDTDTRLLHGMFQLLTDFVEEELGSREFCSSVFNKQSNGEISWFIYKLYLACPGFILEFFIFNVLKLSKRDLGLKHLDWELTIPDQPVEGEDGGIVDYGCPGQAAAAKEKKELYLWWKDVYPNREDPMDLSGYSEFCDQMIDKYGCLWYTIPEDNGLLRIEHPYNEEEENELERVLKLTHEIEQTQHNEDSDMLARLIKIRNTLWT